MSLPIDCENMHLQGRLWAGPEDRFNASETFKSYGVPYGDREGLLKAMPAEHKYFTEVDESDRRD
jgi:hypothetical protein